MTHPSLVDDRTQPIVWILLAAIIVLAGTVVGGGVYLDQRSKVRDMQLHRLDQAVCTALLALPPQLTQSFQKPYDQAFADAGCAQFRPKEKP